MPWRGQTDFQAAPKLREVLNWEESLTAPLNIKVRINADYVLRTIDHHSLVAMM